MATEPRTIDIKSAEDGSEHRRDKKTDGNASFLRAARAGNLEKVLEYLKGNIDINTSNSNGLNALHLASKEGHVNVVTELLSRGANIDAATKKGNTALHIASLAGQEEIVKILVQHGAKVNIQSQSGFTPLYMAAQENKDEVVKFLLANGASQALTTADGFSPMAVALQQGHDKVVAVLLEHDSRSRVRLPALHIAAKKNDVKAATLLLKNKHDPDATSKSGFTPLHIAAHYGNVNVASLLIEYNADVNFKARNNITPLHVSAKWGRTNMVNLLLDSGADHSCTTRDGLTPLHCGARSGHDQVVDILLEKGAPVTVKTKNGLTPLHMAAQGDHADCARILLYHKAPIDEVTVDYLTPLHVAAHCGNVKTAKLLLDKKCQVNARALNGFTPLHIACKKNRIKVVELLLKYMGNLEATTESGLTPLHVASFMGHMNIVVLLIQHGANTDCKTVRGETALHLAARANQTDIIRILLRNGANVDAKAREEQTPLHIASRLGNVDNVVLLLQHGASANATTKDLYTPLHIAAKEGHEEVASVLLDHSADSGLTTKKGFTPLHIAAKYGNMKVARLLLQKEADPNAQGKNGLTPLHVATHYNHPQMALLLLENKASPHAKAKNGYTPLHIAAKKNQMEIATTLLEYKAEPNAESKNGFTPLHLATQEGHTDMVSLLLEHKADVNFRAKNGLTPMHLAAQEDHVPVAEILVKYDAEIDPQTKAGYTPLHTACHFGQINMIRFLLDHGASVTSTTKLGYTPLHQAAQQGHVLVINLLMKYKADPNAMTNTGQTPLSIAQRLGYISVVEVLKNVTEVTATPAGDEKYKVQSPETMQEALMTDSEDEGGDDTVIGDQSYQYLSTDDMKFLHDDSISPTKDDRDLQFFERYSTASSMYGPERQSTRSSSYMQEEMKYIKDGSTLTTEELKDTRDSALYPSTPSAEYPAVFESIDKAEEEKLQAVSTNQQYAAYPSQAISEDSRAPMYGSSYSGVSFASSYTSDNIAINRHPVYSGFLVSFMVDARGGAMRGCRHSGVRIIVPPGKACQPTRVTCKLVKREKLAHPPPLMEGEALASRVLEMGPNGAQFLGPVIIEVPHFASLRGKEREVVILRSDNGETWREHPVEATEDAIAEALNGSFEGEDLESAEELYQKRITRILTTDFPQYFAIVTRIRQENNTIGPNGGMLSSTVVPQVQAVFPEGSLTKKIKVGLQAQPIQPEVVSKLLGNRVAVSPIVTVEPRRRKFHKPITLTIPLPKASQKGMLNQYEKGGDSTPTLRLLCSITGTTAPAQWEDITGTTVLTFINDCVSFTTTVSARFWLMDCQNVPNCAKMAAELYREAIAVPFMSKFVVFAKRHDPLEARLRVFCMTDDKMDKTLESQEHFQEVARSRDVEVLEGKPQYIEMGGNLVPVTKSGEQLYVNFHAFRENRLPFVVRIRDCNQDPVGRVAFMKEPRVARGEPPQQPICNLNITLPDFVKGEPQIEPIDTEEMQNKYDMMRSGAPAEESISKAELRLTDIAEALQGDWVALARQLGISEDEITKIQSEYTYVSEQALVMLHLWVQKNRNRATGNELERALKKIGREDVIRKCMYNIEAVTDLKEQAVAWEELNQPDFDELKEELGPSRDASLRRDMSLDVQYDEQDIMKESESAAASETGSIPEGEKDRVAQSPVREEPIAISVHETDIDDFIKPEEGTEVHGMDDRDYRRRSSESSEDSLIVHEEHKGRDIGGPDLAAKLVEEQIISESTVKPTEAVPEDLASPDDSDTERGGIRVYTDTVEGEPQVETEVQEFEETLPDGTIVKRKVVKTKQKQTIVKRVVMEGPEPALPASEEQAQEYLKQSFEPGYTKYTDTLEGEPESHTDVQEVEEILEDGTVIKRRLVTTTEQQLKTERVVLEGEEIPDFEGHEQAFQEVQEPSIEAEPHPERARAGYQEYQEPADDEVILPEATPVVETAPQYAAKPVEEEEIEAEFQERKERVIGDDVMARLKSVPQTEQALDDYESREDRQDISTPVITITEDHSVPVDDDDFVHYYNLESQVEDISSQTSDLRSAEERQFVDAQGVDVMQEGDVYYQYGASDEIKTVRDESSSKEEDSKEPLPILITEEAASPTDQSESKDISLPGLIAPEIAIQEASPLVQSPTDEQIFMADVGITEEQVDQMDFSNVQDEHGVLRDVEAEPLHSSDAAETELARPLSPTEYTLEPDDEAEPGGRMEADTSQQIFIEQSIEAARASVDSQGEDGRPLSPSDYTLMSQSAGSEDLFKGQTQQQPMTDSIPEDVFSVPEPVEPSSVDHVDLEQVLATEQQYSDDVTRDSYHPDSSLSSTTDPTQQLVASSPEAPHERSDLDDLSAVPSATTTPSELTSQPVESSTFPPVEQVLTMHEPEVHRSEDIIVTSIAKSTKTITKPSEPLSTDVESSVSSEPAMLQTYEHSGETTISTLSSDNFESETVIQKEFEQLELTKEAATTDVSHLEEKHRLASSSYENIYQDTKFQIEEEDIVIPGAEDVGDRFDTKHTESHFAIRFDGKSSSYENLYAESKEASFIEEKDVDEKESLDAEEFLCEKGEGEDEKSDSDELSAQGECPDHADDPERVASSRADTDSVPEATLVGEASSPQKHSPSPPSLPTTTSPIDITYESGLNQLGYEEQAELAQSDRRDSLERSWSCDAEVRRTKDDGDDARQRHYSSPDDVLHEKQFQPLDAAREDGDDQQWPVTATGDAVAEDDDEVQTTRVVMKKQIHKKTIIRDGKEETIVTEDTHIEQDNEGPPELRDRMQNVVDQFMEGQGEIRAPDQQ